MGNNIFEKLDNESNEEYCHRVASIRKENGLTWYDLTNIVNDQLGQNLTPDAYRMKEKVYLQSRLKNVETDNSNNKTNDDSIEESKKKYRELDQRTETNALLRRVSREETLKDIAIETANIIANKKAFISNKIDKPYLSKNVAGILCISDWHYGIEVDTIFNKYSPDIAKERIEKLRNSVIHYQEKEKISELHVVNLGDMISGNIHYQTRLYNRIDVITQTMEVAEIIAEFLMSLSNHFTKVHYYSVIDNHSRFNPDKKEHLQLESMVRIIDWYLKERLQDNIIFHKNKFGIDITTFKVFGHCVLGVHGDKDKQKTLIDRLSSYTQSHYDLILSAHTHHFSANESNMTSWICNGSLMGTDQYASDLRLNSHPSQNLIVVTPNDITESIHKIKLN